MSKSNFIKNTVNRKKGSFYKIFGGLGSKIKNEIKVSKKEEKAMLKREKQILENDLCFIKNRMRELER